MIITPAILTELEQITQDKQTTSIEVRLDRFGINITMYWNQFGQKRGYRNVISQDMLHQKEFPNIWEFTLDKMFKAVEFEVGRLNYENE